MLSNFKYDLPSSLVVFLVALPLCLGIALASGAPLFSGIISGIIGGIVVGLYSHSPLSVSGPAAGLTVIVLAAINQLQSYDAFLVAVVLAGFFQIIFGVLRAGIIGHYFPSAVIKGMLAAIGLILVLKQIPHALGYDFDYEGDFSFNEKGGHNTFTDIWFAFQNMHFGAVIISVVSIGILILWERPFMKKIALFKVLPGALFVVFAGILLNQFFKVSVPELFLSMDHVVNLPVASNIPDFIGFFTFPDFTHLSNPDVYIIAGTIAIIASIESLLSVEATDKLDPYKRNTPTNRELRAQGIGNMISGLIGGIPLTAVIVRSSANINAGGRTRMSTILHGILLLVCAAFIPVLLNQIPLACLAAILLLVGYKLAKISLFKRMYILGWDQFIPFVVTITAILFTDLLKGIGIGMAFSIFFILRNNYRTPYFFHKEDFKKGEKITIMLAEEVTFLNKGSILLMLENLPENSVVTIDGSSSASIDYDVLEMIENFKETAKLKGINLELIGIRKVTTIAGH
ncbi:MAG: SulP family inorganic anion transporter [Bacteroidetes bacterium]|nr:SulP family inorganic anion transporter [Bacteroidota bacterium]